MSTNEPMKRCPYCAEQILAVAVQCKHCQADLSSARPGNGAGLLARDKR